jgi:hypothetical protein
MRPILTALILFGFQASPYAEPGCLDRSKFPALHKFIGTYQTDDFLNDQAISSRLKRLVGKDLALIRKNLSVRGSIDLTSCNLVVSGNAPHGGLDENAIVSFDLTTGEVCAGIRSESSNGEIAIYSGSKNFSTLPFAIKLWIYYINGALSQSRAGVPVNFR